MLQSDPAERITIPELFNHSWIRAVSSSQFVDQYQQFLIAQNPALAASSATDGGKANAAGDNFFTLSPSARVRYLLLSLIMPFNAVFHVMWFRSCARLPMRTTQ